MILNKHFCLLLTTKKYWIWPTCLDAVSVRLVVSGLLMRFSTNTPEAGSVLGAALQLVVWQKDVAHQHNGQHLTSTARPNGQTALFSVVGSFNSALIRTATGSHSCQLQKQHIITIYEYQCTFSHLFWLSPDSHSPKLTHYSYSIYFFN